MQKNEISPYLILYTKINTKCIKDLNITPKTIKLPEENIGESLLDISLGIYVLNMTPKTQQQKQK